MRKHLTKEDQHLFCEQFLSSQLTQSAFCKEKNLGLSTFHKWLRIYKIEKNITQKSQFVQIKVNSRSNNQKQSKASESFEPIQMTFPDGIRINVPPYFNPHAFQTILKSIGR